jgi:hypothetical protein
LKRRRKKKKKRRPAVDASTQARRLARAVLGPVPGERVVPSKRKKVSKHKKREMESALED